MPKSVPAAVTTQMDLAGKRPVLLFELGLASTLRFAGYKVNIVFPTGGNTYTAKHVITEGLSQSLEGQIERVVVKFDNVQRDMAAYAHNEDFNGKKLIIKRVYLDALGNASNYNELFNGTMERPTEISRQYLTVPATVGKSLNRKTLVAAYQKMCPWVFGGAECNTNGLADLTSLTASGTAVSGSTTTLYDNALNQAANYWTYGEIAITKGSKTYYRKVSSFAAGTVAFDVELPVSVDDTCAYVLLKGCDQTWETCGHSNVWGPSGDNSYNFGGCIHITKRVDAE
jgi:hypothetical protein